MFKLIGPTSFEETQKPSIPHVHYFIWASFVVLAGVIVAFGGLSLALRPNSRVWDLPLKDDGYYSLTVARNIAAGKGITIDGTTPTNGFQPLFTFLCVPLFIVSGGDQYLSIRLVLIVS